MKLVERFLKKQKDKRGPGLFKIEDICCLRITVDFFCNGLSSWLNSSTFKI